MCYYIWFFLPELQNTFMYRKLKWPYFKLVFEAYNIERNLIYCDGLQCLLWSVFQNCTLEIDFINFFRYIMTFYGFELCDSVLIHKLNNHIQITLRYLYEYNLEAVLIFAEYAMNLTFSWYCWQFLSNDVKIFTWKCSALIMLLKKLKGRYKNKYM